ncbi:MAG: peptide chain release factor 1 [Candidatus Omnitrophota bacterium]|nr:peptide chain release factor 1 [Candidatus Omnitrophota bacterium]
MFKKLQKIESRYKELEELLVKQETLADKNKYQAYAKELSKLSRIVERAKLLNSKDEELKGLERLLSEQHDESFLDLAKSEIAKLREEIPVLSAEIKSLISGEGADKHEEVIMEIRAGTGGQEASLFVGNLYRMYTKYADAKGYKYEVMASHPTDAGGFKEIIFSISGMATYKNLKYESGVHRVQRVPVTEASGRIHTSTVTVAVLVEPEEVDLVINPQDLKIDVYRSKGAGGQSVNTTDSAVRITHLPSGVIVTCQDERSQLKNKHKAMRVLRARLLDKIKQEEFNKMTSERRSQVGTGDRAEKIRTYNFPDRRITDHRINFTVYRLEDVLNGNIEEFIKVLQESENKEKSEAV